MRAIGALAVVAIAASAASALADPVVLRAATVTPDGTLWGRELRAAGRDIEHRTEGRVQIKWYFNGVAGGEQEMGERARRGQLDMILSGGPLCTESMPSMNVLRLPALFQNAAEAQHITYRLQATLAAEALQHGFVYLGSTPLGLDRFFLRRPVSSLAELRALKLWHWDLETSSLTMGRAMGLAVVPTPLGDSARAFEDGRIDGYFAIPAAAMAFQWSIRAPFLLDLKASILFGCMLVTSNSYYRLSVEDQKALLAATAYAAELIAKVGAQQEAALVGGAFQHQGVKTVPVSERFRAEFFAAANAARDREGLKLVPAELIQQVRAMLADYRAEHQNPSDH